MAKYLNSGKMLDKPPLCSDEMYVCASVYELVCMHACMRACVYKLKCVTTYSACMHVAMAICMTKIALNVNFWFIAMYIATCMYNIISHPCN